MQSMFIVESQRLKKVELSYFLKGVFEFHMMVIVWGSGPHRHMHLGHLTDSKTLILKHLCRAV